MGNISSIMGSGFNAHSVEPAQERNDGPLPAGTYTVECTAAELRELKSGKGMGLSLEFTVIDPEQHARRKVWSNLNIKHESPQAQEIGQSQLAAVCLACGIDGLEDTGEFFGKVLSVKTRIKPEQNGYAARAEVAAYMTAGVPSAPPAPAPVARAANAAKPWEKKAA